MAGPTTPASSGFAQGLLSSLQPWLTGASPSALDTAFAPQGGTMGLLSAMLQASPGSQGAAAFGRALQANQDEALNRAAVRQSLAQQNMGLQVKSAMLPLQLAMMRRYYGAALGSQQPQSPQGPMPQSVPAPPPLLADPNRQQVANTQPPSANQAPNPFAVPTPSQIGSMSIGGLPPGLGVSYAFMHDKDPLAAAMAEHDAQVKLAQQQYGPVLAQLDTLDKAQSPTQYVQASPALMAQWHQIAPTLGFDPTKGFTDANVRTAFSFLRNRLAGALGESTVAPPVQMSQVPGPLNSLYNRNPVTNALTQVRGEESLKPVVNTDGTVSYAPASQANGRTPFNADTYINPTTTQGMAKMIANYEVPPLNGYALRTPQGQAVMAAVKKLNPTYDATQYATKNEARIAFAVGKQGDTVRSLSVASSHLDMLSDAAHALAQHDLPAFNRLVNAVGVHVTGATPQTNFDAMRRIVADEVVKAIVGTGGAESDREGILEAFRSHGAPDQIQGVIEKYEGLMGGQLRGLRRQYQKATGLNDFDSFVSNLARRQLNSAADRALGRKATAPNPLGVGQSSKVGEFTVTRIR